MPETARLTITALTYTQLLQYIKADGILEEALGLAICGRTMADEVKDMVETFTLPAIRQCNGENFLFYTFWIVVNKSSNSIVAELGFKGPPDEKGNVEIGYGTMPDQQGKGYMTEAISGMLLWAAGRGDLRSIIAETAAQNAASIRVLEKNGFQQFNRKETMLWWKRELL